MEVIKELSEEYSKLDTNDIRRTNLLSSVGGKLRANAPNAILENYWAGLFAGINNIGKTYKCTTSILEDDLSKLENPEERDKAERSLNKLAELLDKGAQIYATLDAPEEIQALFPDIQGNLELPDNTMNYIEDNEKRKNKKFYLTDR